MSAGIVLVTLGGTVSMVDDGAGAVPSLDGMELLVGSGESEVTVAESHSFSALPGASLGLVDMYRLLELLSSLDVKGYKGFVITSGTDTLEEVAFFLRLLWRGDGSITCTGAMRPASAIGADGPRNIAAASLVGRQAPAGTVLVVLGDEIHDPYYATKDHTTADNAFGSGEYGVVGRVHENGVLWYRSPNAPKGPPVKVRGSIGNVPIVTASMGSAPDILNFALEVGDGVVVEALGGNHLPCSWADIIAKRQNKVVVVTPRIHNGLGLTNTYGFVGSEMDLNRSGAVLLQHMPAKKARLALLIALGNLETDEEAVEYVRSVDASYLVGVSA